MKELLTAVRRYGRSVEVVFQPRSRGALMRGGRQILCIGFQVFFVSAERFP